MENIIQYFGWIIFVEVYCRVYRRGANVRGCISIRGNRIAIEGTKITVENQTTVAGLTDSERAGLEKEMSLCKTLLIAADEGDLPGLENSLAIQLAMPENERVPGQVDGLTMKIASKKAEIADLIARREELEKKLGITQYQQSRSKTR